jgi:hypothetical protein
MLARAPGKLAIEGEHHESRGLREGGEIRVGPEIGSVPGMFQ